MLIGTNINWSSEYIQAFIIFSLSFTHGYIYISSSLQVDQNCVKASIDWNDWISNSIYQLIIDDKWDMQDMDSVWNDMIFTFQTNC